MRQLSADDLWVLRQLQKVGYTSAIIAGGAVRDAYFDKPPVDVDIFVWGETHSNELLAPDARLTRKNIIKLLHLTDVRPLSNENDSMDSFVWDYIDSDEVVFASEAYYTKQLVHVLGVWNVYIADFETQYQIIILNKPPVVYATQYFDIGLCMCYCDGNKIRYTNEFLTDAKNQTITIAGDLTKSEYEYTIANRVQKMQQRFPGYKLVDPLKDVVWSEDDDIEEFFPGF
jgi:hypothetical protein